MDHCVSVGVTQLLMSALSVQAERRPKSAADKKAEELLMRLDMESQGGGRKRAMDEPRADDKASHGAHAKLLGQLEEAERIMMDRDHTIKQLEQRLEAKSNECERHQANCGRSIEEIKAMKQVRHVIIPNGISPGRDVHVLTRRVVVLTHHRQDMLLLAQQLALSEERAAQAQAAAQHAGRSVLGRSMLATPAALRTQGTIPGTAAPPTAGAGTVATPAHPRAEAKDGGSDAKGDDYPSAAATAAAAVPLGAQVEKKLSDLRAQVRASTCLARPCTGRGDGAVHSASRPHRVACCSAMFLCCVRI